MLNGHLRVPFEAMEVFFNYTEVAVAWCCECDELNVTELLTQNGFMLCEFHFNKVKIKGREDVKAET